jgi:hypothetical protein
MYCSRVLELLNVLVAKYHIHHQPNQPYLHVCSLHTEKDKS